MKYPNIANLEGLLKSANDVQAFINGLYVPCRPAGITSLWHRIRCAWMVFIGRADALVWPEGQ